MGSGAETWDAVTAGTGWGGDGGGTFGRGRCNGTVMRL